MNPLVDKLTCVLCGRWYLPQQVEYVCPHCGPSGVLEVSYKYDTLQQVLGKENFQGNPRMDIWRYLPLLPVERAPLPPIQVGQTPLYRATTLGLALGMSRLFIKDDSRNPTASLKDRASAVVVAQALQHGIREVTCASTGNAASSLAGLAASAGIRSYIFVPETAPRAKVAQLLAFGATVFAVRGTYDDAFELSMKASASLGWYNRNTGYNPYTVEGKKTVAFEMAEQLDWQAPDVVVVPVGDGCIISGVWKGFLDLYQIGWIDRLPRLIAAQAEGSDAIKRALESDGIVRPVKAQTVADGISVDLPRVGTMAVKYIRASGGAAVAVSDDEILKAIPRLAQATGIFAEPSGAIVLPALEEALKRGLISPSETVVILVTGSGLKNVEAALKAVGSPLSVGTDLDDVKASLAALKSTS
jgi:threonine synthase